MRRNSIAAHTRNTFVHVALSTTVSRNTEQFEMDCKPCNAGQSIGNGTKGQGASWRCIAADTKSLKAMHTGEVLWEDV